MKRMDKETIKEILFGASHIIKTNRYMKTLRNCRLGSGCGLNYFRPTYQEARVESYDSSRGGPS